MKQWKLKEKLVLDGIILLAVLLLLRKSNFGLTVHEIGGLAVLGAFVVHLLLNWRWIVNVTKTVFRKKTPMRTRLVWTVDVALLVCFILIGLSGIFISKVVFHFSVAGNWKAVHYFCTALALVFLGIHIGLHLPMVNALLNQHISWPKTVKRATCGILSAVILGFGCYYMATGSFRSWILLPFQTSNVSVSHENANARASMPERSNEDSGAVQSSEVVTVSISNADADSETDTGYGNGDGKNKPSMGMEQGGNHGNGAGSSTPISVVQSVLEYASITGTFAVATAFVECLLKRKKNTQICTISDENKYRQEQSKD